MGLMLASAAKAVAQNAGLCGGHPGNSGLDVVARRSRVAELLAAGTMPAELAEVSDTLASWSCPTAAWSARTVRRSSATTSTSPSPATRDRPPTPGPQILAPAADYVDAPVVFRQYSCPSCWTALYSAVVPADHRDTVATLGRPAMPAG